MFTTLLENPMPTIVIGILLVAILGAILIRTGRGILLWAIFGVIALVLVGVGLEWLIITDRERVEATFDACTTAIENEDLDTLLSYCEPLALTTRAKAALALNLYEFDEVRITDLNITIIRHSSPATAKAQFTAMVTAQDRTGLLGRYTKPIGFTVTLRDHGDRWLVSGHELQGAPAGF